MGAKIISSYARSPYFSAGRLGCRTTKSYRLSATSPYRKDSCQFVRQNKFEGIGTSARVHSLAFRSSMTFQSNDLARSRSRYGKHMRSNSTYRNSVISSPPILKVILSVHQLFHVLVCKDTGSSYLVSAITKPSSTHAMLVVTAPISTTHALDMPAP